MNKLISKKITFGAIAIVSIVIAIITINNNVLFNDINEELATAPPSVGGLRNNETDSLNSTGIGGADSDSSTGLRTGKVKTQTTKVYKVTEDGVTSYSDVPRGAQKTKKNTESTTNTSTAASTDTASTSTATETIVTAAEVVAEPEVVAEIIEVSTTVSTTSSVISSGSDSYSSTVKHSAWESQFAMFPQDENGWSIIKPAVDSRLIYVSSTDGNDTNAKAYFSTDVTDPHNPPSNIIAFKTISEALKLQRGGYSDWVLLKKGDEWDRGTIYLPSGRSSSEPLVITSYGNSDKRPLIKTGVESGISIKNGSFIALAGVEFYANKRDPVSTDFVGWASVEGPGGFSAFASQPTTSIYLEDNVFSFYDENIMMTGWAEQKNIVVRRNQILNSYSTQSHSQGIFVNKGSLLLEENLLEHNGWYQQKDEGSNSKAEGQATMFNHNAYLADMVDTVIKGNIFSRPSSIGIKLAANADKTLEINSVKSKNIVIENNLIIDAEVGISAGGNKDFDNGYRWENMTITNNVMLKIGHSQQTRRTLGWHIDADDWDRGTIEGNYLLCNNNPEVNNLSGISIIGMSRDTSVENNVIYGLNGGEHTSGNEAQIGLVFNNNYIDKNASCADFEYSSDAVINAMIRGAKAQSRSNWRVEYTASDFNDRVKYSIDKKI